MQIFTALVLIAFLYYAPAIYKRIINNFKVSSIHADAIHWGYHNLFS